MDSRTPTTATPPNCTDRASAHAESWAHRYGYRQRHDAGVWAEHGELLLEEFGLAVRRLAERHGHPLPGSDTAVDVVGLRCNHEGARDKAGELMHRIECGPKDPRAIEVELRMSWT